MKGKQLFLAVLAAGLVFSAQPVQAKASKEKSVQSVLATKPAPTAFYGNHFSSTGRPPVGGRSIVESGSAVATMAGYNVLMQGGTAFDAAVAIAGVQGIAEPFMSNFLGGDAEIIVWSAKDQKMTVYNGTGWAPAAATLDFYMAKMPPLAWNQRTSS